MVAVSNADYWQGPGGTTNDPTSGDFNTPGNWSTGQVPDSTTVAVLGTPVDPILYTVTTGMESIDLDGLTVGQYATLDLPTDLSTSSGITNSGSLVQDGTNGASVTIDGALINNTASGTILASNTGSLVINAALQNNGTVQGDGSSTLTLAGQSANAGLVEATNSGSVVVDNSTNLASGVLTGGRWLALSGGALSFNEMSPITELGSGTIVGLSGNSSTVSSTDGMGTSHSLAQTLTAIDSGARLQVLNGNEFDPTNSLLINGVVQLGGGTLGGTIDDSSTGQIQNTGVVSANLGVTSASGLTIQARGGNLVLSGTDDLKGSIGSDTASAVEFSGATTLASGAKLLAYKVYVDAFASMTLAETLSFAHTMTVGGDLDVNGQTLTLTGTTALQATGDISGTGTVRLIGKSGTTNGTLIGASGGTETIAPNLQNSGTVVSNGGLVIAGAVTGTGTFDFGSPSATIEFQSSVAKTHTNPRSI